MDQSDSNSNCQESAEILRKMEQTRAHVIREIITTERDYVHLLENLIEVLFFCSNFQFFFQQKKFSRVSLNKPEGELICSLRIRPPEFLEILKKFIGCIGNLLPNWNPASNGTIFKLQLLEIAF